MSYQKTEDLFSRDYLCDRKHILNTSPKAIPMSIIKEIESNGLTLERIDELKQCGYDIYRYKTQITLHGECEELSRNGRLGGYKCLSLNKNKSVGIKWIAIDRKKKERIINLLRECGWDCVNDSTSFFPTRAYRVKDKEEALKVTAEWKSDLDRIDRDLFYGTCEIYLAKSWLGVYLVCNLIINGIKKENVDTLIEQVSGKSIEELEAMRAERIAKEKAERQKRDREYAEAEAKRKKAADAYNTTFYEKLQNAGYTEAVSNQQSVGTIVAIVRTDYTGKLCLQYYQIGKRTAKPCSASGNHTYGDNRQDLILKPRKCYVKTV